MSPLAGDGPAEAARLRRRQQEDEHGRVPDGALLRARAQVDLLRWARPLAPAAGVTRASWTSLGPGNIGGRIRAIALHPAQPSRLLVGGVAGGIWRSANAGGAFAPLDDFMGNLAVSSLVVDPADPSRIFAGTGEGFHNFDGLVGDGMFVSADGGATWSQLAATANASFRYVNRLATSSTSAGLMLVATRAGLYRSVDLGASFQQVLAGELLDVRIDPVSDANAVASGRGTAFRSSDRGLTWTPAAGLPAPGNLVEGRVELAIAPSNPAIVYASVDLASGEIYRSADGGLSYARVSTGVGYLGTQGWYANTIWVDPTSAQTLVVGGLDLYRSTDGGATLTQISDWLRWPVSAHADHHAVVHHPGFNGTTNTTIYATNDGGLYVTDNVYTVAPLSGWQSLNHQLGVTQLYGGAANASGVVVAGAQDNGMLRYTGDAEGWNRWASGDGGFAAADPSDAMRFFGSGPYLRLGRSSDGAVSVEEISGAYYDAGTNTLRWKPAPYLISDAQTGHSLFISPFVLDPNLPTRMYAGGWSLWRSEDVRTPISQPPQAFGGPSWAIVKAPTTGNSEISAITVQAGNADVVWVGHAGGDLYRTANATSASPTWAQVDGTTLPDRYVFRIAIDATTSPATTYVSLGGFSQPNVWRTTDDGATWTAASGSGATQLPAAPVRGLAIHPNRRQWLYAGTEVGLFTSEDGGASWSVPHDGPANVSIEEVFFAGTQLVAVTHGRGLFRSAPVLCAPAGASCTDGNACTTGDACNGAGVCAGTPLPTDDANPCTVDACNTVSGAITHVPGNAGASCRASTGACDPAEACNGTSAACPADALSPAGTSCRTTSGACDVAEACTGTSPSCPADAFAVAGTACRASAGVCDVAEACTGSSGACPPDSFVAAGTACRAAADVCDVAETCTGSAADCPADSAAPSGTPCRAAAGPCDVAETCTGAATACPADRFVAAGTTCRSATGVCDLAEACTGSAAACPADVLAPATTVCRAANGPCDAAESCSGSAPACPADLPAADGTACDDGNGCTGPDACASGRCASRPDDGVCGAHAVCTDDRGAGACSCAAGFGDCDGTRQNGCETDTTSSTAHCGRCGNPCVIAHGSPACLGGACRPASCDAGYRATSAGCADIDECASDHGGCSLDATCTNTDGGRTCACRDGFSGDGVTCAPVDRCAGVTADDGDPCTEDRCDPASGAVTHAPVVVDDGDACTDDACTPEGVTHVSRCAERECQVLGGCDRASGECAYSAAPDGTSCGGGACKAGSCAATPVQPKAPKGGCTEVPGGESGAPVGLLLLAMLALVRKPARRRPNPRS